MESGPPYQIAQNNFETLGRGWKHEIYTYIQDLALADLELDVSGKTSLGIGLRAHTLRL
jgi:hypothetical protein